MYVSFDIYILFWRELKHYLYKSKKRGHIHSKNIEGEIFCFSIDKT